jgi:hypothetical protein
MRCGGGICDNAGRAWADREVDGGFNVHGYSSFYQRNSPSTGSAEGASFPQSFAEQRSIELG